MNITTTIKMNTTRIEPNIITPTNITKRETTAIHLMGRTGNMLYQIACAFAYCKRYDRTLVLPNRNNSWEFHSLLKNFRQFFATGPLDPVDQGEKHYSNFQELPPGKKALRGYFQNEKYFLDFYQEFYDMLYFNLNSTIEYKYPQLDESIFLHIRGGDYRKFPKYHLVELKNYYIDALNFLKSRWNVTDFKVYVSTDDIPFYQSHFRPHFEKMGVNTSSFVIVEENPYNCFQIISKCRKGGICPNSTFCWWASYVNPNPEKIVIYPDEFTMGQKMNGVYSFESYILKSHKKRRLLTKFRKEHR